MATITTEPVEREAFSVQEWCDSIGISRAYFYKLPFDQRPDVIRLGRRVLITRQAAKEWRERMSKPAGEVFP